MNQFNVFILSFFSFLLSAVCPDKVFVNTKIYTLNNSMPNASVLAIKADKIHKVVMTVVGGKIVYING
tara:strand:- start:268 stop:471 length:204 start_codon:yes stop_codon:yes gene_type:complete